MKFSSKRLLALVPVMLLTSVASTSYLESESFIKNCQQTVTTQQSNAPCRIVVHSLSWYDWLSGSSSTQFHFIDLLELLSSEKEH